MNRRKFTKMIGCGLIAACAVSLAAKVGTAQEKQQQNAAVPLDDGFQWGYFAALNDVKSRYQSEGSEKAIAFVNRMLVTSKKETTL